MDKYASWAKYLNDPLVLVGFFLMLFSGLLKFLMTRGPKNISKYTTVKLFRRGFNFLIFSGILLIVSAFGLSLYKSTKVPPESPPLPRERVSQRTSGDQSPAIVAEGNVNVQYAIDDQPKFLDVYIKPEQYRQWQIEKSDIRQKEKEGILNVLELFENDMYREVERALQSLDELDPFVKQFKRDFKTAILFAESDYVGALESILDRYQGLPINDVCHRWEIAYVIYFFRREKGIGVCEAAINRLQQSYRRKDISHVWMAIHPGAFNRLLAYDLYPYQSLNRKQIDILNYVVRKYPKDAFIDHAYYFLHEYDRIIEEFPQSIIIDRAYYAKPYLEYYDVFYTNRITSPSVRDLSRIANGFIEFISRNPNNKLTGEAYSKLAKCYLHLTNKTEALDKLWQLLVSIAKSGSARLSPTEVEAYSMRVKPEIYALFDRCDAKEAEQLHGSLNPDVDSYLDVRSIWLCIARKAFKENDFELAYVFYKRIRYDNLPEDTGEILRFKALKRIADTGDIEDMKTYCLEMALALKSTVYNAEKAIPFLNNYMERYAKRSEIPKITMLKAFCYRDARDGLRMVEQYRQLLQNYPEDDFADDALAELGVYHLLWGNANYAKAREIFYQVIQRYPNGNAVDNCHNWIAWSYVKEKKYRSAYRKYKENLVLFPYTRFAKYARANLKQIREKITNW